MRTIRSHSPDIESFYRLPPRALHARACAGTACFVARHTNPGRWREASTEEPRVYCLGKCYAAPATTDEGPSPLVESRVSQPIVLARMVKGGARELNQYTARGGYRVLEKALGMPPEALIAEVEVSGLRGRGGAGFPTGKKWRAVANEGSPQKYVVANADEGDPGAYIDRFIIEDDPHCLIEALAIAGHAVGARKGYIYLRSEYPNARKSLERAMDEARRAGLLGSNVLNKSFDFDIEVTIGRGSYICGEETGLLNSIEGKRPDVRSRPPYPAKSGLFARPTLVNNVETLANIPWIVWHGGQQYRSIGVTASRGTKVISLNSLFNRPGLYEVEFGLTVRDIIYGVGGGLRTGDVKGVIIGGPLAGIVPPSLFDTPFGFDELHRVGASVGHGGVIAFDTNTSIVELTHHVFSFGAYESCGKCTPCRLGSPRIESMLEESLHGGSIGGAARSELREIVRALGMTSLCGLGTGLADFAYSVERYYGEQLDRCFA